MGILRRAGATALGVLLAALGLLMALASRVHPGFRRQVTRDVVVEVSGADGAAHHFVFTAATRRMASRRGPAASPDVAVRFDSGVQGLLILLSPTCVGRIVRALQAGRATASGNPVILLWFYGLTRLVIPYSRQRRQRAVVPGTGTGPSGAGALSARIVREPAAAALDRGWAGAAECREQTAMLRVAAGERIPMW